MPAEHPAYRLSPLAESDLEDIWLYTFRQWSLEQADTYHRKLMEAVEGLACGQNVRQRSTVREGYWKYPVGRHVIFFRTSEKFLDVIRILHEEMDISQHLDDAGITDGEN